MIALMFFSIIMAVAAGFVLNFAADDDNPVLFFLGFLFLATSVCLGVGGYEMHDDKIMNYETTTPAQVDTTFTINPDKTIDTVYTYHFPKE